MLCDRVGFVGATYVYVVDQSFPENCPIGFNQFLPEPLKIRQQYPLPLVRGGSQSIADSISLDIY